MSLADLGQVAHGAGHAPVRGGPEAFAGGEHPEGPGVERLEVPRVEIATKNEPDRRQDCDEQREQDALADENVLDRLVQAEFGDRVEGDLDAVDGFDQPAAPRIGAALAPAQFASPDRPCAL